MMLRAQIEEIPGHSNPPDTEAGEPKRRSRMQLARQILAVTIAGFLLRPVVFVILPGVLMILLALYVNGCVLARFCFHFPGLTEIGLFTSRAWLAGAGAYQQAPPTVLVGGLVSVVIPFFNPDARFLRETVESVMSQTYRDWEIILVDDGSEEGAGLRAARTLADARRDRLRLVTYEEGGNRGASAARNEGLRYASGVYVAFLDADDVWLPEKLAVEVSALKAHREAGMAYSSYLYWYNWSVDQANPRKNWVPALGFEAGVPVYPPQSLTKFLAGAAAVPTPSCALFRRDALHAVGGWDASFPGLYDDQVLFAKVALRYAIVPLNTLTTLYRQHSQSICAMADAEAERYARARYLSWLDNYVAAERIPDRELRDIIRNGIWSVRHPRLARGRRLLDKLIKRLPHRRKPAADMPQGGDVQIRRIDT